MKKVLLFVLSMLFIPYSNLLAQPAADNFPGLNINAQLQNNGCSGRIVFVSTQNSSSTNAPGRNVFLPITNSTTPPNSTNIANNPYTTAGVFGKDMCVAPNGRGFFKVALSSLPTNQTCEQNIQSSQSSGCTPRTAWYRLDNPSLSNICYRVYTANHSALTNIKTAIAIYRANGNTPDLCSSNLIPVSLIQIDAQRAIDLQNPANSLNNGIPFVFDPSIWPTKTIPKVQTYYDYRPPYSYNLDWSGGSTFPGGAACLTTNESYATNISMDNANSFVLNQTALTNCINQTYAELYNPLPNTTYYIQVIAYPNMAGNNCNCDYSNNVFFTLSITEELLSDASYSNGVFNHPVYLTPIATFWKNQNNLPRIVSFDIERPFTYATGTKTIFDPDPNAITSNLNYQGYGFWSNGGMQSYLSFYKPSTTGAGNNSLGFGKWGSSAGLPAMGYLPNLPITTQNIRTYIPDISQYTPVEDTPIGTTNSGHNFCSSYIFPNISFNTYSVHSSFRTNQISSMSTWQQNPPQRIINNTQERFQNVVKLEQNTPNPIINDKTRIAYELPQNIGNAQIIITDLSGKQVKTISLNDCCGEVEVSAHDLSDGTFIYSLVGNGKVLKTNKMVVVKN